MTKLDDMTSVQLSNWVDARQGAAVRRLRAALLSVVRQGENGRWYTRQHGDTDVTNLVADALEQKGDTK